MVFYQKIISDYDTVQIVTSFRLLLIVHQRLLWILEMLTLKKTHNDCMKMFLSLGNCYASTSKPSPILCPPWLKFLPSTRADKVNFTPVMRKYM